ncbi:sodium:dicarboxylate symporter (plasmid) [Haloterrigena turkmenica DSM 5511]|uniref:Sodium:dicarboxylate symporter n=1 Tax=Haloterrigena turkmenica (strain ATCC 51198 / DSM 5511 / JCM 9101 / NCIMB 13204 / VKM B-1734 / 4k) TaxID=543526 RepID=D2S321_HALTV|nr:dicarboxylate/amino acid:cation symporter [Haloterrigena turkmenica]ADB63768.1 sodium:dicarboxylate symporter [Haloterrigena turkmenica DSM 5511]
MVTKSIRRGWNRYRSVPIVYRIGAAFVLGSVVGLVVGEPATVLEPLGELFVRLLSMIVVPIIIFTLLMGIKQLSPTSLGKIGGQVVAIYMLTTVIAITIGLTVANLIDPGAGLTLSNAEFEAEEAPSFGEVFLGIVPENPIDAMASGDILATIFFVIVFGLALVLLRERTTDESVRNGVETFFDLAEAGSEALFTLVWGIMEYGVLGIFALMAVAFAEAGVDVFTTFAMLALTLVLGVAIHITVVYLGVMILLLTRQSPIAFLAGIKDALVTALSISSSSATLPVSMSNADENLHVNEGIYSFSLPLGATINMDGTSMYLGIVAVFAANVVGASLTLVEQLTVVSIAVLAGIGTAGVPSAGLILMTLVLTQVGLPVEVVGFIAGIDPLLDRLRTMTNVTGDLAVATLVGHLNGGVDFSSGSWSSETGPVPSDD